MPHKSVPIVVATSLIWLGITSLLAVQTPNAQPGAASPTNPNRKSLDAEMMDHQREMQSLATNLVQSFQAIADARDKKGFVRDNAILKAHSADIKALRDAYRTHETFVIAYEHECSISTQQADIMIQHQQLMKSVLYDLVDTFDIYENANAVNRREGRRPWLRPPGRSARWSPRAKEFLKRMGVPVATVTAAPVALLPRW